MAQIISGSIDLSKIDKNKIVEGKNGAKYYNIDIHVKDELDQYGNCCSITTKQTKEEREAKEKKVYLGNGKRVWQSPIETAEVISEEPNNNKADDDLPF